MRSISLLFLIAVAASAQTYSSAQTFGMVGIAAGQKARFNVLNVGGQGQAAQCVALMAFLDDQSSPIKVQTFSVQPGRAVSLDLASDVDLGLANGDRQQIRAVVAQFSSPTLPESAPGCVLAPTLEIFDLSTGRTSLLILKTTPIPQTPDAATQSLLGKSK